MYKQPFLLNNRISLKLVQKISNSYRYTFDYCYFDRFGILDQGCKHFELPSIDNTDFLKACLERADELSKIPNLRICFSGGVDTTFLLALFKSIGKEVKLLYFEHKDKRRAKLPYLYVSPKILKFARENYDFKIVSDPKYNAFDGSTYTACLADGLFFPTQPVKGGWEYKDGAELCGHKNHNWNIRSPAKLPDLSIEEWMRLPGNGRIKKDRDGEARDISRGVPKEVNFSDEEIERYLEYVKLFDRPMNSNWSIVRLINFCFSYYQYLFEHPFDDKVNTKSFFDTQKFTNMTWTQYWDANKFYPPDKTVEYKFIRKVFGTDFGVKKNW